MLFGSHSLLPNVHYPAQTIIVTLLIIKITVYVILKFQFFLQVLSKRFYVYAIDGI